MIWQTTNYELVICALKDLLIIGGFEVGCVGTIGTVGVVGAVTIGGVGTVEAVGTIGISSLPRLRRCLWLCLYFIASSRLSPAVGVTKAPDNIFFLYEYLG